MYHLPNELIDYIFSFDDNAFHRKHYNAVMKELDMWYNWRRTNLFLENKYNTYKIYYDYQHEYHHDLKNHFILNMSQYILWVSKNYSRYVYVDSLKWKLRNRTV